MALVERDVADLLPVFLRERVHVLEVLVVGDKGVLQRHQRDHRLLVARGQVLVRVGDEQHIARRHEHRAQQVVLRLSVSPRPHG